MQQFKVRASAAGQLMGAKGIGKTGENLAEMWLKSQIYNRRQEIKSKYLVKGNVCENESIFFIQGKLDLGFLQKNKQFFEDDFFTGTPDIITDELIIDVKNSWDWSTFPLNGDVTNKDYYFQLQVYMHLTGKKKSKLIYILFDTPEELIEKEAWYKSKELGMVELDYDIYQKCLKNMTYSDIADDFKYRVFNIEYNPTDIEILQQRVEDCRKYLTKFIF